MVVGQIRRLKPPYSFLFSGIVLVYGALVTFAAGPLAMPMKKGNSAGNQAAALYFLLSLFSSVFYILFIRAITLFKEWQNEKN